MDAARWFSSGYEPHINTAAFEGEEAEAEAEYGLKEDEEESRAFSFPRQVAGDSTLWGFAQVTRCKRQQNSASRRFFTFVA